MKKTSDLFKINLVYFCALTMFVGLRIFASIGVIKSDYIFTVITQIGILFLLVIFLINLLKRQTLAETLAEIGFKKISFKAVGILIAIGAIAFVLNIAIATFFNGIMAYWGYNPASSGTVQQYTTYSQFLSVVVSSLFFVAVLPALFEEILHRGFLLNNYRKTVGTKRAIVYSSLLFGLMHLNISQFFYAAILGAFIAILVIATGSIWAGIIVHFINNGLNIYLSAAANTSSDIYVFGQNFYDIINNFLSGNNVVVTLIVCFLILALLCIAAILLIVKLLQETKLKRVGNVIEQLNESIEGGIITEDGNIDLQADAKELLLSKLVPDLVGDGTEKSSTFNFLVPTSKKDNYKPYLRENMFLYASIFLGVIITIFTFIWGVL